MEASLKNLENRIFYCTINVLTSTTNQDCACIYTYGLPLPS